jgi:hypothetical protein
MNLFIDTDDASASPVKKDVPGLFKLDTSPNENKLKFKVNYELKKGDCCFSVSNFDLKSNKTERGIPKNNSFIPIPPKYMGKVEEIDNPNIVDDPTRKTGLSPITITFRSVNNHLIKDTRPYGYVYIKNNGLATEPNPFARPPSLHFIPHPKKTRLKSRTRPSHPSSHLQLRSAPTKKTVLRSRSITLNPTRRSTRMRQISTPTKMVRYY